MDEIVSLCKRRGFIFPASEIYGGFANIFDYGPLGTALKNNIKNEWWKKFVISRDDMVGVDSAIIQNPKIWEASGHLSSFSDPLVECKKCHERYKVDNLLSKKDIDNSRQIAAEVASNWMNEEANRTQKIKKLEEEKENFSKYLKNKGWSLQTREEYLKHIVALEKKLENEYHESKKEAGAIKFLNNELKMKQYIGLVALVALRYLVDCNECGEKGDIWTLPKEFNLMFKTFVGSTQEEDSVAYMRPETAQGIFTNFKNVTQSTRVKVPFGIAQIGKAFRNEITPGNFIFRTLEFEQAEIEYFVENNNQTSQKHYKDWTDKTKKFFTDLGVKDENLSIREHDKDELSHYSIGTSDIEYEFPFGVSELAGIAQRIDFDLKQHEKFSGEDLKFKEEGKEPYIPYVVEPSFGITRALLAFLVDAFDRSDGSDGRADGEVTLRLHKKLAPIKVAVFPLMKKEGMADMAKEIVKTLKNQNIETYYDESGSVGKRYRRQDEIGTPWCITVDFDSLKKDDVTVRDRDTMKQERVKIVDLPKIILEKLK